MTDFLLLASIFLVAGVIFVPLATKLGLGSVLGYLIAGIVISPLLGTLGVDVIAIQHFAEFGVVMMLFLVGLELEPKLLWNMRARLVGLGGLQVGITTLLVALIAFGLGQPPSIALAVGLVLALSSTAIVLQTFNEKGLMRSDGGQAGFSVLLFQDIAVIPMLALLPLLAMPELMDGLGSAIGEGAAHGDGHAGDHGSDHGDGHGEGHGDGHGSGLSLVEGLNGWQTALVTLAAIGAVWVVGSRLARPLFQFIGKAQLRELFTAGALMLVIVIALLMSLVNLSPALGAFVAGVVLASSEYKHQLESDIDPFRGLLLGLFFMTVGAGVDFTLLSSQLGPILAMAAGLMVLKAAVLYGLAIAFKVKGADRWLLTLSLAQAGEFGFVLLSFTVANAILPEPLADQLLLVVALSMFFTPLLFIAYDRLIAPHFSGEAGREADEIEAPSEIIVAGHGRFGGIVSRMLRGAGFEPVVVDFSSDQLEMLRRFEMKTYFGDATRPDLLKAAGIETAKLLIIAIDGKEDITRMTEYVRQTYPNVHVISRATTRHHVYELYAAGGRDIIRETYDSALRAGRSAFEALGYSREQADSMTAGFDEMDRRAMIEVAPLFDPDIPTHENEAYVKKVLEIRDAWESELAEKMGRKITTKSGSAPDPETTEDLGADEATLTPKADEG